MDQRKSENDAFKREIGALMREHAQQMKVILDEYGDFMREHLPQRDWEAMERTLRANGYKLRAPLP